MEGKNITIVDRVVERLKLQPIGDLITEDDLHEIVKEAIPKVFFERRSEHVRGSYRDEKIEKEPAIFEIMRECMRDEAAKVVREYLAQHADQIAAYWTKVLDEGLMAYVEKMQKEKVDSQIRDVLRAFMQPMNDERARQGLPLIYL